MSDRISLRTTLARYLPPWLTARLAEGKVRGFKLLYSVALLCDAGIENAYQGVQARFPGVGTATALPYIGRDRRIRRGIGESDESYAARLITWLDDWQGAGTPYTIMRMVQAYCAPAVPRVRIVNGTGTWYTLTPDGTFEVHQTWPTPNWDWDGDASKSTRCWLIIYSDQGPWSELPAWGDPSAPGWGDPGTSWGTTATPEQIATVRAILADFKSGGDRFENIIIAFDPASFDPTAAPGSPGMPDGTWGHWSKNVGGVQVPARLGTARYWDGVY